ncbi:MAG: choice-of-anchor tandem repeat GloVer-containing protein [Candidatus Korobacteraceae bacterium]
MYLRTTLHRFFTSTIVPTRAAALGVIFVFAVASFASAQTYTVLHNFTGYDGYSPFDTLTLDAAGNLYGTAALSFPGKGTVFELKHAHGAWLMNPLFYFDGANGWYPSAGVVFGPDGRLYGTTFQGGLGSCQDGCGVVYALQPPPGPCSTAFCRWNETILYQFSGGSDGALPVSGNLVFDASGNLYGTTTWGGTGGHGTVFELSPANGGWTEKVLYSFAGGDDGADPIAGVVFDAAGNIFGTTQAGGGGSTGCNGQGCGTVFELSPAGTGWTETVLHRFQGTTDGGEPDGALVLAPNGNFYGATLVGGLDDGGVVFALQPAGGSWTFVPFYDLPSTGLSGGGPMNTLAVDASGALYGANFVDGADGLGSVFKLAPGNGGWIYSNLYSFMLAQGGYWSYGGVILDSSGNLYGTTADGGLNYCGFETTCGVIWEVTP